MENLRKEISRYIRMQENVYHYAHNTRGQVQAVQGDNKTTCNTVNQWSVYYTTNGGKGYQAQSDPTELVFASFGDNGSGQRIIQLCIFCEERYYNDQYKRYATLAIRKRKLNEDKQCFSCLKTGYV